MPKITAESDPRFSDSFPDSAYGSSSTGSNTEGQRFDEPVRTVNDPGEIAQLVDVLSKNSQWNALHLTSLLLPAVEPRPVELSGFGDVFPPHIDGQHVEDVSADLCALANNDAKDKNPETSKRISKTQASETQNLDEGTRCFQNMEEKLKRLRDLVNELDQDDSGLEDSESQCDSDMEDMSPPCISNAGLSGDTLSTQVTSVNKSNQSIISGCVTEATEGSKDSTQRTSLSTSNSNSANTSLLHGQKRSFGALQSGNHDQDDEEEDDGDTRHNRRQDSTDPTVPCKSIAIPCFVDGCKGKDCHISELM